MLGSLARWLRVCGLDVFYDPMMDRSSLFRVAREEGRTLFTRSRSFGELKDIPPYIVIESDHLEDQLRQVKKEFPEIDLFKDAFSRCVECNTPLVEVDKNSVKDEIPPRSFTLEGPFFRCPSCKKLFWPGTHVTRIKERLKAIFL